MPQIKCIAFDCFGTVFDMAGVNRDEIAAYVEHVKQEDFLPYNFPLAWYKLKSHPDAAEGIKQLQTAGYKCYAMSNGTVPLISGVSEANGIKWNGIVDLILWGRYKPHVDAYRAVGGQFGYLPCETMMVTANPTFGDIEGAAAIGMQSQVIRQPGFPRDIIDLADILAGYSHA